MGRRDKGAGNGDGAAQHLQDWLSTARDGELELLGVDGIEDIFVSAFGPDESEVFRRARFRAVVRRCLESAVRAAAARRYR